MCAISIIIVNYNVKHFLDQCLQSLEKALVGIQHEVIVVDNHSSDNSESFIKSRHQHVQWIANQENVGFSIANNQGIHIAKGKYILLLNPDTLVNENTLTKLLDRMELDSSIGAAGVKMIDGTGAYLPESKRGFPSPFVAFAKFSGLSKLFPKSKFFNTYHLGHLSPDSHHIIDILCGAFMMIRADVIEEVGMLDEDFFMYGEDIDWSYRIQKAGHAIHYFGDLSIVHFKGESTKKGSLDYVKTFYNAMLIFAGKHFSSTKASWFKLFISAGIYLRAGVSIIHRIALRLFHPVIDFIFLSLLFWSEKELWEQLYHQDTDYFPTSYLFLNIPLYAIVLLTAHYLTRKGASRMTEFKYIGVATIILLAIYGLLPFEFRPSRFLVIVSALTAFIYYRLKSRLGNAAVRHHSKLLIVAPHKHVESILQSLEYSDVHFDLVGFVSDSDRESSTWLGPLSRLQEIIETKQIDEIIFDSSTVQFHQITEWMESFGNDLTYRITSSPERGIVGSLSKNSSGQMYTLDTKYRIQEPHQRLLKRSIDILGAICLLLLSPLLIWRLESKKTFFKNCLSVLRGESSWVSYHPNDAQMDQLPSLKKGILNPMMTYGIQVQKPSLIHKINQLYAKDYSPVQDIRLVLQSLKSLDHA